MGFTYNDIHSDDKGLVVQTSPSILPPITIQAQMIPDRPGGYFQRSEFGMRPIKVPIGFRESNFGDYYSKIRDLAEWLNPIEPEPLIFDDESNMTYYAVLSDAIDLNRIGRLGSGTLTFLCPDPFAYGSQITQTLDPNNSIVTLMAAQDSPYSINPAPIDAQPIFNITFTAAASSYQITHQESGKYIKVNYGFAANNTLTIDATKRKITINGVTQMTALDWANSQWFNIVSGDNHFTISPSTGVNTDITYSPRWL